MLALLYFLLACWLAAAMLGALLLGAAALAAAAAALAALVLKFVQKAGRRAAQKAAPNDGRKLPNRSRAQPLSRNAGDKRPKS